MLLFYNFSAEKMKNVYNFPTRFLMIGFTLWCDLIAKNLIVMSTYYALRRKLKIWDWKHSHVKMHFAHLLRYNGHAQNRIKGAMREK